MVVLGRRGHYRSVEARQRQLAEEIVGSSAFRDRRMGETVNTLKPEQIIAKVYRRLGECSIEVYNRYAQGEVRTDSRSLGVLEYPERMEAIQEAKLKGWDRQI